MTNAPMLSKGITGKEPRLGGDLKQLTPKEQFIEDARVIFGEDTSLDAVGDFDIDIVEHPDWVLFSREDSGWRTSFVLWCQRTDQSVQITMTISTVRERDPFLYLRDYIIYLQIGGLWKVSSMDFPLSYRRELWAKDTVDVNKIFDHNLTQNIA